MAPMAAHMIPDGETLTCLLLAFVAFSLCASAVYVANDLLVILEKMLKRPSSGSDSNRRKSIESLVAAHERLWLLRHPEARES